MSPIAPEPTIVSGYSIINYAGFWKRFLASLLDGLIITACFSLLVLVFGVGMWDGRTRYDGPAAWAALSGMALFFMLEIVASWLYFALMESSKNQGTLGKMALGLRVTDIEGRRISFGRATGRYFGKILSGMTLLIGYLMAVFTQKKQALHDFVAGTLVLSKQSTVSAQVAHNAYTPS